MASFNLLLLVYIVLFGLTHVLAAPAPHVSDIPSLITGLVGSKYLPSHLLYIAFPLSNHLISISNPLSSAHQLTPNHTATQPPLMTTDHSPECLDINQGTLLCCHTTLDGGNEAVQLLAHIADYTLTKDTINGFICISSPNAFLSFLHLQVS